jgi:hypothetical protein
MVSHLFFYQLALIALVWLFVMLLYIWPSARVRRPTPAAPLVPRRQHTTEPQPFAGLTTQPYGALCEQESAVLHASPPLRPAPMPPTNRHPHTVEALVGFQGLRFTCASETRKPLIRPLKNNDFRQAEGCTNRVVRSCSTCALGIQYEPPDFAHVAWPRVGRRMAGRYACPLPSSAWRRWHACRSCLRVGLGA